MYKFADGYDNEVGLITMSPQPRSEGLKQGRVTEMLDGSVVVDGYASIDLLFNVLLAEDFEALCSFFGVSSTNRTNECTISIPVDDSGREFDNYNGIIHYPVIGDEGDYHYWWNDVIFKVKRLRLIT